MISQLAGLRVRAAGGRHCSAAQEIAARHAARVWDRSSRHEVVQWTLAYAAAAVFNRLYLACHAG